MKIPRPSKKIIAIFVVCLTLVGLVFAFLEYKNREKIYANVSIETLIAVQEQVLDKDTDKDGLKDWEETLWKTDSQNPDSDGDGAADGEEVKLNRDPAKAGPDDKLDQNTIAENKTQTDRVKNDTARFSNLILQKFLALRQTGEDLSDVENYQDVIASFITATEKTENLKAYGAADLKIVPETSASVRAYGNALGELVITDTPPDFPNEIIIWNQAAEIEDEEELKKELQKLDLNIAEYKRIRNGLLKMAVPKNFTADHINLLNIVETLIFGVEAMQKSADDPILSIAGIERYPAAADSLLPAFQNIAFAIREGGTVFAQGEPGADFLDVIINPRFIPNAPQE